MAKSGCAGASTSPSTGSRTIRRLAPKYPATERTTRVSAAGKQDKIDHHFSVLGSNYYPELDRDPLPGQLRAGAHTDFGSLTILAPTEAPGGLQVMIGDERWRSTLHRVANPPAGSGARSRRKLIAFWHPNYDVEISCIESCASATAPPKYPPILAGRFSGRALIETVDGRRVEDARGTGRRKADAAEVETKFRETAGMGFTLIA